MVESYYVAALMALAALTFCYIRGWHKEKLVIHVIMRVSSFVLLILFGLDAVSYVLTQQDYLFDNHYVAASIKALSVFLVLRMLSRIGKEPSLHNINKRRSLDK
ncbi:MAG: hypothetical protein CMF12_11985 [Idiomarina sp.]|uniref:hypothetical protein n=1 Tax=Idiomarina sp. TaxID=1874361 RepID=UPI000C4A1BA8|nr:hypothetical protein [Idiomarina sp.]MBT43234.1 hypothetical protein [Idiomarina sp.]